MRRLAFAAAVGCACVSASAASAGVGVQITGVDTSSYPDVQLTVSAPPVRTHPQIVENGLSMVAERAVSLGAGKVVVLAVDRSQSMAGTSLRNATGAAQELVRNLGASDDVEVVGFGRHARVLSPFWAGGPSASSALDRLRVDGASGTALWDAVVLAAKGLAQSSATRGRAIVLVTDGKDVSSSATLTGAIKAARAAHAGVYAVGIASRDFTPGPLLTLTRATGGAFLRAASSRQLAALYRSIGRSLARTWQLDYRTAASPGAVLHLRVDIPGAGSAMRAVSIPGLPTAAVPRATAVSKSAWTSSLAPLVLAGTVGLLVLVAALLGLSARGRNWLSARLEPHLGPTQRRKRKSHGLDARSAMKRLFAATERALADVKQFRTLQRMLVRADLPLLAAELVYISLGSAAVLGIVGALAGASAPIAFLFGIVGLAVPLLVVAFKARSRMRAFDEQLPDLLTTIAASLKAGHSFRHAIQAVVDEGADPASKEFRRVITETRLGRSMDDALGDLSGRIGSKNLAFALTAVTIQRQIGGSLAGLFDMVADTVRQRQQFARKIRALTAMGRMSAYVLIGLPFVVALSVTALNHRYMAPLWGTSSGHELVGAGLTMIAIGSVILRKIVSFRG